MTDIKSVINAKSSDSDVALTGDTVNGTVIISVES